MFIIVYLVTAIPFVVLLFDHMSSGATVMDALVIASLSWFAIVLSAVVYVVRFLVTDAIAIFIFYP